MVHSFLETLSALHRRRFVALFSITRAASGRRHGHGGVGFVHAQGAGTVGVSGRGPARPGPALTAWTKTPNDIPRGLRYLDGYTRQGLGAPSPAQQSTG
jgi:hypothetical protein